MIAAYQNERGPRARGIVYPRRMVWGGATLDAIARLRKDFQQVGSKRSKVRPHELGLGPKKEAFDCMFLCDECGYLCDTNPPCPSCGREAWIDLDYWALAEALRAREEEARRHPPEALKWRIRGASLATGTAIGGGCAVGLALAGLTLAWPVLLGLGATATAVVHSVGRHRFGRAIMTARVQSPSRWRLPLPLADAGATTASRAVGPLEPRGPLLRAPFTGRPCLGYDVAVLFDAPDDAWPPTWVLREVRSAAFEIEGRAVAADAASLALPIEPVQPSTLAEDELRKFLRVRGLFLVDGKFDLYEAIVEPGRTYELLWPSAPAGAPPFVHAAAQRRGRDPYR
jgi:hypothetical protein